ncbi:ATP-binding protein [Kitasatospora terrestris]|uniref:histidine kinase n=1 Tax=Kitasatospora terrestris TaxID=258051 RepID=A0ABP9E8Q8_9ACTN
MPGTPATHPGHRAGRSGSLRTSLLPLVLVPCLGLALGWGWAAVLLLSSGHGAAAAVGTPLVAAVLAWSLVRGRQTALALTARIDGLRELARGLAESELPDVVDRIRAGEDLPPLAQSFPAAPRDRRAGGDELQQVAEAVDAVRSAAVAAIVQQAQGREGSKKVFLNIARRTQVLIHRQINMLDALEREHEEPELLKELFAVDHLATRMRRNAENLVILGGALPARRWRNAVPMVNVLRSSVSETENYARVAVQGVPRISLSGQAVADVIHLTAELIENGTTFSPPYTQVLVSAQEVPKGLAVEVEDRGLGMSEEEYERLNAYLADPPELDVAALGDDLRLGLFVVSRLAARHDIQVTLRPSPYGGTRAVVLVPAALLEQPESPAGIPGLPFGARVAGPAAGPGAAPALSALTGGAVEPAAVEPQAGDAIPGLPGAVVAAFSFPRPTAEAADPYGPLEPDDLDAALAAALSARAAARPEALEADPAESAPTDPEPPVHGAVADAVELAEPARPGADWFDAARSGFESGEDDGLRTPAVLPKRVRNASLADQLREAAAERPEPAAPSPAEPAAEHTPQRSRATMAAIQRGTRSARLTPDHPAAEAAAPAPEDASPTEDPHR